MKSLLSRVAEVAKNSNTNSDQGGLYVYIDVNSYIPPELLSHLLSVVRSQLAQASKPVFPWELYKYRS